MRPVQPRHAGSTPYLHARQRSSGDDPLISSRPVPSCERSEVVVPHARLCAWNTMPARTSLVTPCLEPLRPLMIEASPLDMQFNALTHEARSLKTQRHIGKDHMVLKLTTQETATTNERHGRIVHGCSRGVKPALSCSAHAPARSSRPDREGCREEGCASAQPVELLERGKLWNATSVESHQQ